MSEICWCIYTSSFGFDQFFICANKFGDTETTKYAAPKHKHKNLMSQILAKFST